MNGEIKSVGSLFEKVTTIFKSIWETLINSLKRRMEISKVSVSDTHMVRKVFKIIGVSATGLLILGGIGTGIWYYFDEIRPKHRATQILNNEISSLIKLEGILLYNKCNDIIRNHNIPHCGKEWRDQTNLAELSDYAWVKVEYLAYQGNADAQFLMGLKYGGYNFLAKKWVLKTYNPYLDYNKAAYWYLKAAEQNHGSGGEGSEHKALKDYVINHPSCLSLSEITIADEEHILPSGDRLDVYFECLDGSKVAIEVKPSTSDDSDLNRGIFQCIKYKAVLEALSKADGTNALVKAILVTKRAFSDLHKRLIELLGVDVKIIELNTKE